MRRKFAMACALLMTTLWVGVPPVMSYARGDVKPVITGLVCDSASDIVRVSWSKVDGKPVSLSWSQGLLSGVADIPASRWSKGDWTFGSSVTVNADFETTSLLNIYLYNKAGTLSTVYKENCYNGVI